MPERNDADFEARRQQIIDGALDVFARKGVDKATNREIAAAAGIKSPGLIYHYFKDKSQLYQEVLEQRIPLLQLLAQGREMESLPLEEGLRRFGKAYLAILDAPQAVMLVRLLLSDVARHPAARQIFWQTGPARALGFLAEYLDRAMERGELRRTDSLLAARQFMGPLVAYLLSRALFSQPDTEAINAETVLEQNVRTFLGGMRAEEEA